MLKDRLSSALVSVLPDECFIPGADVSSCAIGGVLSQLLSHQKEHVVAYGSRMLNKSKRNYCMTRKEVLPLAHFAKHFRQCLRGWKFVVRIGHSSLQWSPNFKGPEGQVARWQERSQEYHFKWVYTEWTKSALVVMHGQRDPQLNHGSCPRCAKTRTLVTAI